MDGVINPLQGIGLVTCVGTVDVGVGFTATGRNETARLIGIMSMVEL